MQCGTVDAPIVPTKRLWEGPSGALLKVRLEDAGRSTLIAFDVLGCGTGERVLVVTGSAAAAWFPDKPPPVDALIIASIK
jgi:ethanolamine utilization protein EutN